MADVDAKMGWLDRIVDFNLGADYFAVGIDTGNFISQSDIVSVVVNFPSLQGGTPGLRLFPCTFPNWPTPVGDADVAGKLTTLGGHSLSGFGRQRMGFGVATLNPFPSGSPVGLYSTPFGGNGIEVYLKTGQFGPGPYLIEVKWTVVAASGGALDLAYFPDKGAIKVKANLPPGPFFRSGFFRPSGPSTFTDRYTVNPRNRAILPV